MFYSLFKVIYILPIVLLMYIPNVMARADGDCGELTNAYGPYDYTNPIHRKEKLDIVERAHFDSGVERLERGQTSTDILHDIDYTLRAFPNHHRALNSMATYQLKHQVTSASRYYTADCYFIRAIRFKPDDSVVYLLYGIYFHRKEKYKDALAQYNYALRLTPKSAETHYNMGLLYVDMNKYDEAKKHAIEAYKLGYPLPGLKNQLKKLGVWND